MKDRSNNICITRHKHICYLHLKHRYRDHLATLSGSFSLHLNGIKPNSDVFLFTFLEFYVVKLHTQELITCDVVAFTGVDN